PDPLQDRQSRADGSATGRAAQPSSPASRAGPECAALTGQGDRLDLGHGPRPAGTGRADVLRSGLPGGQGPSLIMPSAIPAVRHQRPCSPNGCLFSTRTKSVHGSSTITSVRPAGRAVPEALTRTQGQVVAGQRTL